MLKIVNNREAKTLLEICFDRIEQGSLIYSDSWSAYNKLIIGQQTVNNKFHFVDPNTGVCTNTIESLWKSAKSKFKEMHGCKRGAIQ